MEISEVGPEYFDYRMTGTNIKHPAYPQHSAMSPNKICKVSYGGIFYSRAGGA